MEKFVKQSGFTIIEVLAATAMVGVSLVFLLTSLSSVTFGNAQLKERSEAVRGMYNYAALYAMDPSSNSIPFVNNSTSRTILPSIAPVETRVTSIVRSNASARVSIHTINFTYSDISGLPVTNFIRVVAPR